MKTLAIFLALILILGCIGGSNDSTETSKTSDVTVKDTSKASPSTTVKAETPSVVEKMTDMASAIASGQSYSCIYTVEGATAKTWIKGKKFKSEVNAQGTSHSTISDGVWAYTWTSGEKKGMKYNLEQMEQMGSDQEDQDNNYQDIGDVADMADNVQCTPTIVSDSTFTPPSDVEFDDMGELIAKMQNMADGFQNGPTDDPCAICQMIPDEAAKKECQDSCG